MNLSWALDLYGFKYASLVTISEVRIHIQDEIQHHIYTLWGYVPRLRKLSIRKKCKGKTTENNPESLLQLHRPPDNCSGSTVMSSEEELKLGQVKLFKVLGP